MLKDVVIIYGGAIKVYCKIYVDSNSGNSFINSHYCDTSCYCRENYV